VCCEATQFGLAATNQNEVAGFVDWSQPWPTGSLHSALTAIEFR